MVRATWVLIALMSIMECGATLRSLDERNFTPEQFMEAMDIPVVTYTVATEDGFVLQLQRMPNRGSPVIYLQHGLLDSSCTWVMNQRSQSLGFALYDAGYDVWLGNTRGNRFSTEMVNGSKYNWYWSIDEIARFDVSALLGFILNNTGKQSLSWVGHSRGTQMLFYGLSKYPHYAKSINLFIALAPVAWVSGSHVESAREWFTDHT